MHKNFLRWYETVALDLARDEVPLRWQGVQALATEITTEDVVQLVRLTVGLPAREKSITSKLRAAFKKADPKFRDDGNDSELRVLAGATLVELLSATEASDLGTAAALLLIAADLQGKRAGEYPQDFVGEARKYVTALSYQTREDRAWPKITTASLKLEMTAMQSNWAAIPSELERVAKALSSAQKQVASWIDAAERAYELQQEQLDVAWWVFGGISRDLDRPVRDIPVSGMPLVLGRELADQVRMLPGPLSAAAFLDRMLSHHNERPESVTLREAVFATETAWQSAWVEGFAGAGLGDGSLPLGSGIRHAASGATGAEWDQWVQRVVGISPETSFSLGELGRQAYTETLAYRAVNDAREAEQE